MNYGEIVSRSFRIWMRHPYLWILGLLGGGSGVGGFGFGGSTGNGNTSFNTTPQNPRTQAQIDEATRQLGLWITQHLVLLGAIALVLAILWLLWLVVACIAQPALIEAAAWHDGEHRFDFRSAWGAGRRFFGRILALRLLLTLALVVPGIPVAVLFFSALVGSGPPAGFGAALVVPFLLYSLALTVLAELAVRSVVLERVGVMAGIRSTLRVARRRPGRVLVVWLLGVVLGVAFVFALTVIFFVVILSFSGAAVVAFSVSRSAVAAVVLGLIAGIQIAGLFAVVAATSSFFSVYWTLAYRRLDLDRPPPAFSSYAAPYPQR